MLEYFGINSSYDSLDQVVSQMNSNNIYYRVDHLVREWLWILSAKLEAWYDSGFDIKEDMLPNLIGTELEKI